MTTKAQFQADKGAIKAHASLIARVEFRAALDVAMLEYVRQQSVLADEPARGDRIQGAHEFVSVFLGLGNLTAKPTRRDSDNLNHIS